MNWGELKTLATRFVHRSDIPFDSVQFLALDDLNESLVVQENEGAATIALSTVSVSGFLTGDLPTDFVRARAALSGSNELEPTDISGLLSRAGARGFYSVSGSLLWASVASVNLIYSKRIAALASDTDRNVLTDKYSGLFISGLLKWAGTMVQDFEAKQSMAGDFDTLLAEANATYAMTLSAGVVSRSPYAVVSN